MRSFVGLDLSCLIVSPSGEMEQLYKGLLISISGQVLQWDVRGEYPWVLHSLILVVGIALFCKPLWFELCPERVPCGISPAWAEEDKLPSSLQHLY